MILILNLALILFVCYFIHNILVFLSGVQRVLVSLIICLNIYFIFSSISYFLSLNLPDTVWNASLMQLLTLATLSLVLVLAIHQFDKNRAGPGIELNNQAANSTLNTGSDTGILNSLMNNEYVVRWVRPLAVLSIVIVLIYCISAFFSKPHGEWDAWAIWNLKARFLFRSAHQWPVGFSDVINWSHPDYPLLLPALVAGFWRLLGGETVYVAHSIALFYLLASAYVMYCLLGRLAGAVVACVALLLLVSSYSYIRNSVYLTADMPLANLLLMSVCLFSAYCYCKRSSLLLLSFLFLSATFWLKNEGLLIFLVFATCYLYKAWRMNELKQALVLAVFGMLPCLMTLVVFKTQIHLANDLFERNSLQAILSRAGEINRYGLVFASLAESVIDTFKLNLIVVIALLFSFRKRILRPQVGYLFLAILLCLLGYLSIYVLVTPHDLTWHLNTSMQRILLHFYPSFVFVLFLTAAKQH